MSGSVTVFGALGLALYLPTLLAATHNRFSASFSPEEQLATGDILVANEKLGDANFARSVVLIMQFDPDEGTVGVILNRRTKIPISQLFPKTKHATHDPVYLGGPVQINAVQALLRLSEKTAQATHIVGDVYVSGSKELIEKSIASHSDPSTFRLYLGYARWAPGQLEAEIHIRAWSLVRGRPQIVFDDDPDSLWRRMTRELQMQIAGLVWPKAHVAFARKLMKEVARVAAQYVTLNIVPDSRPLHRPCGLAFPALSIAGPGSKVNGSDFSWQILASELGPALTRRAQCVRDGHHGRICEARGHETLPA